MKFTFLLFAFSVGALAQNAGKPLAPLTDQDPKGSACGQYFRKDGDKIIYHLRGDQKAAIEPVDYIAKIVEDDKAGTPSVIVRPIADGDLLTIVLTTAQRNEAKCLPATIYVEKR